jgi:prostaglandin-endoperoxide synthase 2
MPNPPVAPANDERRKPMSLLEGVKNTLLRLLDRIAPRLAQRIRVNFFVRKERGRRPHPFSLWTGMNMGPPPEGETAPNAKVGSQDAPAGFRSTRPTFSGQFAPSDYVSWPGLADRRYTGRHLPPAEPGKMENLPDIDCVVDTLFRRRQFTACAKTSTLFCFFAQWFTDSFLRTDPHDRRRNTSNHEIDYCQIYGLDEGTTLALRTRQGGRMRMEGDMLPRLTDAGGKVRQEFLDLSYIRPDPRQRENEPGERLRAALGRSLGTGVLPADRWTGLYAAGLERGNSTMLYTALSTLAVREHNRIAHELEVASRGKDGWDDDRLFETARTIMIRNVLQIVMEDYINHLAGGPEFRLDTSFAEREPWYRTNRISIEFNLLYRWHSLVPDEFSVGGETYAPGEYRYNNALLEKHGLENCINAASTQKAGRIQLYNTPEFLLPAERASLDMARTFRLRSFVDYCDRFGERRPADIAELVGPDKRALEDLTRLYGTVDNVELPVGLLAQARAAGSRDSVLPPLVRTMVAADAFTHIFTNPLLAAQVHRAAYEDSDVLRLIADHGNLAGMARRNQARGTVLRPSFSVH